MSESIAITGMGVVSPIGCTTERFWDSLHAGRTGAGPVNGLDTSDLPRKIACQVRDDVPPCQMATNDGPRPGRAAQLAVAATRQAVESARITRDDLGNRRTAIIVGTTMGETEFIEERLTAPAEEWLNADHMHRILGGRPGSIAGHVADALLNSQEQSSAVGRTTGGAPVAGAPGSEMDPPVSPLGKGGGWSVVGASGPGRPAHGSVICRPSGAPQRLDCAVATPCMSAVDLYGACAAGNMAIASARRQLLDGRCDIAVAGGADGFSRLAFLGFMRLRVMAAEVCRPFDERRDGLFVGEGAAFFVMERESSARARGATILARVLGAAVACENYHPTRPHPDGDGLTRSTLGALSDADLSPSDIDYICAHGTGTPQNDAIEVAVMQKCFTQGVAFSSIKALTGHTMGAAAALEAAACILSLQRQTLIPTWHLDNVLQPCSLDAIRGAPRSARVRHVLNNSAGFGGYNSSVIFAAA